MFDVGCSMFVFSRQVNIEHPTSNTQRRTLCAGATALHARPTPLPRPLPGVPGRGSRRLTMSTAVVDQTAFELTDEQVAFYHEHGYLAPLRLLDERQLENLRG